MVIRSLVTKIYLYAIIAFFLTTPIFWMLAMALRDQGRHEGLRAMIGPQLQALEHEVERSLTSDTPDPETLANLGKLVRHDLRFVPWSKTGTYPAELGTELQILDPRPIEQQPRHWIRIDRHGHPVGALEVRPIMGRGPGGPFGGPKPFGAPLVPPLAWAWMLLFVLVVVPPLWFWVIRPLKAMVRVARRLGSGDLETPIAVDRKDEFGALEQAFEHMRVELRRVVQQRERLLTDVSHEIRGPLARMTLALPLLRQEGASGPITEIFERELKTADTLLGDVLALARGKAPTVPNLAPLDLAAIAGRLAADRALVVAQKDQTLTTDLTAAPVMGDDALLARAMGNLLDNALKYTPSGGHISLETSVENGMSLYTVTDDGPGIATGHLPQIFEPFYRPDDSRSRETGGTGLGLAIVRGIADNLGGSVEIQSRPGQGTRAVLRFPTHTTMP